MLVMMAWRSGRSASAPMLASSIPSSSLSSYSYDPGYSTSFSSSLLVLPEGRVWGRWPLPTVSGRPVVTISFSRKGEGGGGLIRLRMSKTSSRCRGLGVPSTLCLSCSPLFCCNAFEVLGRGLLAR